MPIIARTAFFFSGVAALSFEIVWMRYLGLALGATTLAVASTTAAYMGGLALGSHLSGRVADRLRRPVALYGALEIAVGLMGTAVPWLCMTLPRAISAVAPVVGDGLPQGMLRFSLALLVLAGPTIAMGATLPLLARAVTQRPAQLSREVGLLYAINTAGALTGAGLSGFWWIPSWGLHATNNVAVMVDLMLGIGALVLGWRAVPASDTRAAHPQNLPIWRAGSGRVLWTVGLSGAAAMALQVLWTRALGTALGPSTYAFTAIVCAYLTGLALGAWVAAYTSTKVSTARLALCISLVTTAFFVGVGITWVDDLPQLLHHIVLNPKLTMNGLVRTEFLLASLSLLPATVAMGTLFPLGLGAVVASETPLGAAVGRAYAINTAGAIAGCFGAVFVLLPAFGVEGGMRAAALLYVASALLVSTHLERSVRQGQYRLVLTAATVCGIGLATWPRWDVGRWTAGLYRMSMARAYYADGKFDAPNIIFHQDGLASTVTVEEEEGARWIKVNGKIDGSSEGDMPTQILSGLLPMLIHPAPQSVAVIGCGSCVTVGAALQAGAAKVTLVELERRVVEAAHLFVDVNHAPWDNPNLTMVEDDGRNFLSRPLAPFDVIESEPSNPWMTGAASLFTEEFFRLAAARLKPDGLFLQWLQMYELDSTRIASVLKTFHSAFAHTLVFSASPGSNDLLLLGSMLPIRIPLALLRQRFDGNATALQAAELIEPMELLALLLLDEHDIDQLPFDVPLNTDDNAFIEFGAPKDLLTFAEDDPDVPWLDATAGKRSEVVQRVLLADGPPSAWLAKLANGYLHQGMLEDATATAAQVATAAAASTADLQAARDIDAVVTLFREPDRVRVVDSEALSGNGDFTKAVVLMAQGDAAAALTFVEQHPDAIHESPKNIFFYGYLLYTGEAYEAADKVLIRARSHPKNADLRAAITYYLARNAYNQGNYRRAVAEMLQYQVLADPTAPLSAED